MDLIPHNSWFSIEELDLQSIGLTLGQAKPAAHSLAKRGLLDEKVIKSARLILTEKGFLETIMGLSELHIMDVLFEREEREKDKPPEEQVWMSPDEVIDEVVRRRQVKLREWLDKAADDTHPEATQWT
jgi:hypothetical protein